MNIKIIKPIKTLLLTTLIVMSIVALANSEARAVTSVSVGLGIDYVCLFKDDAGIFDKPILYQDDDKTNDTINNNDNDNGEIELDEVTPDDKYPIWDIVGRKYYETPFRRFEIIFFASFSYLLFLNVTIIETISTVVPYFGGRIDFSSLDAAIEGFGLPLIIYAFVSSFIFAVAVAVEDYRFVYIKNAHLRNRHNKDGEKTNSLNSKEESKKVDVYFAPSLVAMGDSMNFGLLLINF